MNTFSPIIIRQSRRGRNKTFNRTAQKCREASKGPVTLRIQQLVYVSGQQQYRQAGPATILRCPNPAALRLVERVIRDALRSLDGVVMLPD